MEIDAFYEWLATALREAGLRLGRARSDGARPVTVTSFQALWDVFREGLRQPLSYDCGALVVVEWNGNVRNRTCDVELARRAGEETFIYGVVLQLTSRWPRTTSLPERFVLDQQNHGRVPGEEWLLPLDPPVTELESSATFQAVLSHPNAWECILHMAGYGD